jgi:hypothetical protein
MKQLGFLVLTSSLLLGSVGCIGGDDGSEVAIAEAAVESTDSADAEGNMMLAVLDGADTSGFASLTANEIAVRIAANVAARWNPRDCAKVTQNGSTITIALTNCTGPRGLAAVNGTLVAEVTRASGAIAVHISSPDLRVNDAQLTFEADATYVARATEHELVVSTSGSGVGPRGGTVERTGDYTITLDTATQCRSIDGSWSTELGDRSRGQTVELRRCADACPTGTVTRSRTGGMVTVTFDGTSTATWSATTGKSGTIALRCR